MRRSCRAHRDPGGIVGPDTARGIISVLLRPDLGGTPGVAMLWLDRHHHLLDSFVVRATEAETEEVAEPVLRVRGSPVGAVVLGSVLPEGRRRPTKRDRGRFLELRRRHGAVGIELLDWFVVAPTGRSWSLAEEVARMER